MIVLSEIERIILPYGNWQEIVNHGKRKLAGNYLPGESQDKKAYGLLTGVQEKGTLHIRRIFPAKKNVRHLEPYKSYVDKVMEQYAVLSKTPFSLRGWMTDPIELKEFYDICDRESLVVVGAYHLHIVAWKGDALRDTPTLVDKVLAQNSNLFSFIVSMVDESDPRIRSFFEGDIEKEVPLCIDEGAKP